MLQRIQSVYLFCAAFSVFMLYFVPFGNIRINDSSYLLNALGFHLEMPDTNTGIMSFTFLTLLTALSSLLSVFCIFIYKRRLIQIKLCRINLLMLLGIIAMVFFYSERAISILEKNGIEGTIDYKPGVYLPIISVVFIFLAARAIKKDENLVRSADRIR